jgi:hypothetical protein
MTITNIENTLNTLEILHPDLDEAGLFALLNAGGWEEKNINDAIVLFRNKDRVKANHSLALFNPTEEKNVLPEVIDTTHELLEHNPNINQTQMIESVVEKNEKEIGTFVPTQVNNKNDFKIKSSLEIYSTPLEKEGDSFPENLPLVPFESTARVWSFSKYKNLFHGDFVSEEKKVETPVITDNKVDEVVLRSNKDDKLLLTAYVSLFTILLLLGYMYISGRL